MKVVSNTSPLIFLSKLDALELLAECFSSVSIPNAVIDELKGLVPPEFVVRKSISKFGSSYVKGALGNLHLGELEAIVLAQESKADFVLLDDRAARNKAVRSGLSVMGTVGVLKLANSKGLLTANEASNYYDLLINKHGLFLSGRILTQLKASLV